MTKTKFTLGADPEFFLTLNGEITSAEGLIGGGKWDPVEFDERRFFMQEDNVMVEFNIPPAETKQEFIDNIEYAKEYLSTFFNMKGYLCKYDEVSSVFPMDALLSQQASTFGCEPDYNVYLKDINSPPAKGGNLRCCGGHIHVGFDFENNQENQENIIKALDITLGLDSVLLDRDTRRKEMYGKAGSFRFKPYGVEYRTLSNFWIKNPQSISWVYDKVEKAFNIVDKIDEFKIYEDSIIEAIDNNKRDLALEVLTDLESILTKEKV